MPNLFYFSVMKSVDGDALKRELSIGCLFLVSPRVMGPGVLIHSAAERQQALSRGRPRSIAKLST